MNTDRTAQNAVALDPDSNSFPPPTGSSPRRFSVRVMVLVVASICALIAAHVGAFHVVTQATSAAQADTAMIALIVLDTAAFGTLMCSLIYLASVLSSDESALSPRGEFDGARGAICILLVFLLLGSLWPLSALSNANPASITLFSGRVFQLPAMSSDVKGVGLICAILMFVMAFITPFSIRWRWWSKCPFCNCRRARWVNGEWFWYDFRCSACGFTQEKVWRSRFLLRSGGTMRDE